MKHIRLFEGFNKDDYYQEITQDEWVGYLEEYNFVDFSYRRSIEDIFKGIVIKLKFPTFCYQSGDGSKRPKKEYCVIILDSNESTFPSVGIYELADEYFITKIGKSIFLCDQLDGLKKLLKDKDIIK